MKLKMIFWLLPFVSLTAGAVLPAPGDSLQAAIRSAALRGTSTYQIGGEWGKKEVTTQDMAALPALDRAAHATAHLGGATSFVLGKFDGRWILATNYHVCPSAYRCEGDDANFTLGKKRITVSQFLGSWSAIDLALLVLEVTPGSSEEKYLERYAGHFNFAKTLSAGQELVTVGYGTAGNPWQDLVGNWDSDCKVFSQPGDIRFMADPDAINPGPYSTWSIAVGCDASHGDSGSAMVDRATGEVIGLIWTGKFPKTQNIQNSDYLTNMLNTNSPEIWTELNYVVPASAIQRVLRESIQKDNLEPEIRALLDLIAQ